MKKQIQDQQLAERFAVSTRTVRRWRSKGIDLANPLAVADCILKSKSATPAQFEACKAVILAEKEKEHEHAKT
jgi:hypothetical protein